MEKKFLEKIRDYDYGDLIIESEYWLIFLAPDQKNLGTCVVAIKREESELSGLKEGEWSEFSSTVVQLESAIKNTFNATMFNWGCLMNSYYLTNDLKPHLHWHFIPRYRKPVEFNGRIFNDPCFGRSTLKINKTLYLPALERAKIVSELQKFLKF